MLFMREQFAKKNKISVSTDIITFRVNRKKMTSRCPVSVFFI